MLFQPLLTLTALVAIASSSPLGDLEGSALDTRTSAPGRLCRLTNYQPITAGPLHDGVAYLRGKGDVPLYVGGGKCTRISCSYGTAIGLCNDSKVTRAINSDNAGNIVEETAEQCGIPRDAGGRSQYKAFQWFRGDGLNLLVHGVLC